MDDLLPPSPRPNPTPRTPHLQLRQPPPPPTGLQCLEHSATRPATPADKLYLIHLARKFSNHLGFLPPPAIEKYLDLRTAIITQENSADAGYILWAPRLRYQPLLRPILQAAVQMDAQRRHHGLALLAAIEADALAAGQLGLQANCALGLEANEFWHAAGFTPICHLNPRNARNRQLVCWRKPLTTKIPLWFAEVPRRTGHQAKLTRLRRDTQRNPHDIELASHYITRADRFLPIHGRPEKPQ